MSTPNLALDHVTENQRNKAASVNVMADGLDNAMNTVFTQANTGSVNLTAEQFRANALFYFTGTPGAGFVVTVPMGIERAFTIANGTDAELTVEFEDASSDGVGINVGETAILHSTGSFLFTLATGSTAGSATPTTARANIENDGTDLGRATVLNFTGNGVVASENSDGVVDIDVPGPTPTTITELTTDFEITNAHLNGNVILEVNSATPVSVFLEQGLTSTEPVTIIQTGAGQVTVIDASAVVLNSAGGAISSRETWSTFSIIPRGSDSYVLAGDLV